MSTLPLESGERPLSPVERTFGVVKGIGQEVVRLFTLHDFVPEHTYPSDHPTALRNPNNDFGLPQKQPEQNSAGE